MIASDVTLRDLVPEGSAIGPASVDLHLGPFLDTVKQSETLDPETDQFGLVEKVLLAADGRWHLEPRKGYLGVTSEFVTVPPDYVAVLDGISSLGRLWLVVHCTAGYLDPGWDGPVTLEIVSLTNTILLRPGMRIAQVRFCKLTTEVERAYEGRYLSSGPQPVFSRAFKDKLP